ncbi:hypothetical protein Tco_0917301 [Tanacetum coccineum]
MVQHGNRHRHQCHQVLDVFKDKGRLSEAILFTGTTRNSPFEMGKNIAMDFITSLPKTTSRYYAIWVNPRYIGPFKILAKVGTVAYRLELLEQLSRVHSAFHVSNLKKCLADETLAIPLDEIQID